MRNLNEDIHSKHFKKIYLLYGEEEYLLRQFTRNLSDAVVSPEDSMNRVVFEEKQAVPQAILESGNEMPFFAEQKLILLKDTGFFKKVPDELMEGIGGLADTTVLLFSEHEVDKRNRLYKYVNKNGRITEFKRQDERTLSAWIGRQAKERGMRLADGAAGALLARTGNDMERIANELSKLFAYCMDSGRITQADIDAVCPNAAEEKVFAMIDAIAGKNRAYAMRLYGDLLMLREPPLKILALLTRQFHNLMRQKDLEISGCGRPEIAKKLGIPQFAVRRNSSQASRFTAGQLQEAFRACIQTDEAIKTGQLEDRIALELLITELLG